MRRYGTPEDVAGLVNWLAGDEAKYASGQLWVLDGGLTAQVQQMRLVRETPMSSSVIITCAVTGGIHTPTMSPHLPITPGTDFPEPPSKPLPPARRSCTCMRAIPRPAGPTIAPIRSCSSCR